MTDRRKRAFASALTVFAIFLAAPTAGDIGSCGQAVVPLDANKFFAQKELTDCEQCTACGLATKACKRACDKKLDVIPFPAHCYPLVHDGEVCLHALRVASCADYASFVADAGATIPSECDFCPALGAGGAAQ